MVEQNAYRGFGIYRFANGDQIETTWGTIQEDKVQSNSQQSGGFFRDLVSTMLGVDIPNKNSREEISNNALLVNNNDITYTWADGRKFIGIIKNATLGEGTYYLADGTKAPKKEHKKWVVQQPVALSITMPASENIIL